MKKNILKDIYGPGDDNYGRNKAPWKQNETEKCVICGVDTKVPVDEHINKRDFYVEGAGQLCQNCYNKVYGSRMIN